MNKKQFLQIALVIIIAILVIFLVNSQSRAFSGTVQASYINVGEGDSILLRDGNGFEVLY